MLSSVLQKPCFSGCSPGVDAAPPGRLATGAERVPAPVLERAQRSEPITSAGCRRDHAPTRQRELVAPWHERSPRLNRARSGSPTPSQSEEAAPSGSNQASQAKWNVLTVRIT